MIKGKLRYLERLYPRFSFKPLEFGQDISGSSPPSVFIGRKGYPKVYVGPLIPAIHGDTKFMDTPESWLGKNDATDIISFRFQLVRGKELVDVKKMGRQAENLQSIALAEKSVDIEASFKKKPKGVFFHEEMQPFGPSAPLKEMKVDSQKFDHKMEKAYYDTDLLAKDAVIWLYEKRLLVSSLQKAFSVGAFGLGKNRKLVPTRWSITAVDDTLGSYMLESIKQYDTIGEFRVYEAESLNNKFVIIFMPTFWRYETMEAWFPQIIGDRLEIYSDYETFDRRTAYARIGGCYYAARLAVAERLEAEKRQAGVIILRESYPGYIPLGVFNVRENVREALRKSYMRFETLKQALDYAGTRLRIPLEQWIGQSQMLKNEIVQKRLADFVR